MTEANGTGSNANAGDRFSSKERPAIQRPPLSRHIGTQSVGKQSGKAPQSKDATVGQRAAGRTRRTRRRLGTPRSKTDVGRTNLSAKPLGKRAEPKNAASKPSRTRSTVSQIGARPVSRIDTAKGKRRLDGSTTKTSPLKSVVNKSGSVGGKASGTGGKLVPLKKAPLARRRSPKRKMPVPLLYLSRIVIAGLGVAVLGGTLIKAFPGSEAQTTEAPAPAAKVESAGAGFPIALNQEIASLKSEMQELPNLYPDLTPKAFYLDVDTGNYVNLEGTEAIAAASTIKLPILLAFFEEVDAGNLTFERPVEMLPEHIAEGSGDMQLATPGTRFTALEVASQMIVTSDNTATNMMIDLLGGPIVLNERFASSYGLEKTQLNAALPDVEGTNLTSAKDLVRTMLLISGDRLSMKSRDRILNILNRTHNKALLADGMMQKEALTFNKTGYIGIMLGDIALVDLANGKRYIVAAMVERPMNDNRATELIHRISDMTYETSAAAVQPSVTPLGNPDGVESGAASETIGTEGAAVEGTTEGTDEEATEGITEGANGVRITPVQSTPAESASSAEDSPGSETLEEDPYPSANP